MTDQEIKKEDILFTLNSWKGISSTLEQIMIFTVDARGRVKFNPNRSIEEIKEGLSKWVDWYFETDRKWELS